MNDIFKLIIVFQVNWLVSTIIFHTDIANVMLVKILARNMYIYQDSNDYFGQTNVSFLVWIFFREYLSDSQALRMQEKKARGELPLV